MGHLRKCGIRTVVVALTGSEPVIPLMGPGPVIPLMGPVPIIPLTDPGPVIPVKGPGLVIPLTARQAPYPGALAKPLRAGVNQAFVCN